MDAHPNLAVSTVATAPSPAASGTSLVVASGEGTRFATTPPFNATVWPANARPDPSNAEIVRVTNRSTDTLTIARAQEGTSARTVVAGDLIAATVTAKTLTDIETVDATAATGSLRTLGTGAAQAAKGDQTEFAFSSWKTLVPLRLLTITNAVGTSTYPLYYNYQAIAVAAANSGFAALYLDPADFAAGTRTTKLRIRGICLTNAVAPAVNITVGLYPIATFGGASGAAPTVASVSAATASVTFTTPGASSQAHSESAAVTFPAAGWFCVAAAASSAAALNSSTMVGCEVQVQQI